MKPNNLKFSLLYYAWEIRGIIGKNTIQIKQ